MWVYEKESSQDVFVTLRVPKDLWDQWEYRHKHFGAAIHRLRLTVVDLLASRCLTQREDRPDPFYRGHP